MKHSPINPGENGFTLIEILIAITLFAIGILAVSSLQLNSIKGNTQANSHTLSGAAASNRSEHLRSITFTDARLRAGVHPAQPHGRLWVGWNVIDDVPLAPITRDTDGREIDGISISKTIDIVVFSNTRGFDDLSEKNRVFTCSFVKTRTL